LFKPPFVQYGKFISGLMGCKVLVRLELDVAFRRNYDLLYNFVANVCSILTFLGR